MTSIEELLVRDIAAITGGIVVTDSDLREAREAVEQRIHGTPFRPRRRSIAAVAAAAVLLAVAGGAALLTLGDDKAALRPADPGTGVSDADKDYLTGSAPTTELLSGVWRVDDGVVLIKFNPDGAVAFDNQGTLFSHPATIGSYVVDGYDITVTTTQALDQSCARSTYTMRASLPSPGVMRYVTSPADFNACSPLPAGRRALEQVLPTASALANEPLSVPTGWEPLSDKAALYGFWFAERGGYVLELDADGSYYVADALPNGATAVIDQGRWTFAARSLTLTSVGSIRCSDQDALVLGPVQQQRNGTTIVRGNVTQNACRGEWATAVWVLLPNARS
ncbi:MAG: hypothetical protein QOE05_1411 [Actinomycetota bacterium]|jgi:hypothetical protein|nr:hypothetical protein [Actinomycetota bacterium]